MSLLHLLLVVQPPTVAGHLSLLPTAPMMSAGMPMMSAGMEIPLQPLRSRHAHMKPAKMTTTSRRIRPLILMVLILFSLQLLVST
jgi:hypothetical protein